MTLYLHLQPLIFPLEADFEFDSTFLPIGNAEVHESNCLPSIDRVWSFGRLAEKVQEQDPWGTLAIHPHGGTNFRGFQWRNDPLRASTVSKFISATERNLDLRVFSFSVGERLRFVQRTVGGHGVSIHWIWFDGPSEYLVPVEESSPRADNVPRRVTSLSFITTKQKYGPYGTLDGQTTPFCSDPGLVVDFAGHPMPCISFHLEFL